MEANIKASIGEIIPIQKRNNNLKGVEPTKRLWRRFGLSTPQQEKLRSTDVQ